MFMTTAEASITATSVPEDIRKILSDAEKYQNPILGILRDSVR